MLNNRCVLRVTGRGSDPGDERVVTCIVEGARESRDFRRFLKWCFFRLRHDVTVYTEA